MAEMQKTIVEQHIKINELEEKTGNKVTNIEQINPKSHLMIRIDDKINTLGVPSHLKGYLYLCEAVKSVYYNTALLNSITKALYPDIAKKFNTTISRVERGIKHAIAIGWKRSESKSKALIFGYVKSTEGNTPNNAEFIRKIVDKLHEEDSINKSIR
ncbi:sporulation initiation factor Spo0A C-terminal domain-containing protein [Niallia circulans]